VVQIHERPIRLFHKKGSTKLEAEVVVLLLFVIVLVASPFFFRLAGSGAVVVVLAHRGGNNRMCLINATKPGVEEEAEE